MMPTRAVREVHPRIHPATASDADFILSLVPRFVAFRLPPGRSKRTVQKGLRTDIERALAAPGTNHFFVAAGARGQRTGFVHLLTQADFFSGAKACHVSNIAVAEGCEGQGVGQALLEYAQRWAKARRCKLLTLAVFPGNVRARALYERAGFVPDLLRMEKPLRHK